MDRTTLEQQHSLATALLAVLEQQAAGYTSLTIPAHLKLQLDEKRQEVASLKARLAQLQGGGAADTVPDNLPRYCHVFVGRTKEMARCLAALAPEERGWGVTITEVRSSLERLVTLSLVNDVQGECYGLHPLTRAYVTATLRGTTATLRLQLEASGQRQALRYWVDYARRYGGDGKDAYKTYDKLEAEWQTLEGVANTLRELSGLPGSLQDREAAQILIDLQAALRNFLDFRGYWDERFRLSKWRYEAGQGLKQWRDAGWGAYDVVWIHYLRGETDRAATWVDRMAAAMERGGSRRDRAIATQFQGVVAQQRRDCTEAERCYREALAFFRELGEERSEAIVLNDLGAVAREQGEYDRAEPFFQQALAIAEKLNDKQLQATRCGNLGQLALDCDRPQEARPWLERAIALAQEVGRQDIVASNLSRLARVLESEGCYEEALVQLGINKVTISMC